MLFRSSGDANAHRDWFWFVNGLAGDRSASSYRLRDGDIAWWDYRDWAGDAETLEVVAGAFPEPFVHGFDGRVRPAAVRYGAGLRLGAERLATAIGATDVAPLGTPTSALANLLELVHGAPRLTATMRREGSGPTGAVRFSFAGPVDALLGGTYARRFTSP